jgi:hypothetical protein
VLLDLDRALTIAYGTNEAIHNRLASFSDEAIKEIKAIPQSSLEKTTVTASRTSQTPDRSMPVMDLSRM